jgi:hypothetical protein
MREQPKDFSCYPKAISLRPPFQRGCPKGGGFSNRDILLPQGNPPLIPLFCFTLFAMTRGTITFPFFILILMREQPNNFGSYPKTISLHPPYFCKKIISTSSPCSQGETEGVQKLKILNVSHSISNLRPQTILNFLLLLLFKCIND